MYLISAYFDEDTNKIIQRFTEKIAERTGNHFLFDNHVPPHVTVSSVEARSGDMLIPTLQQLDGTLLQGTIQFVSVGAFFPYVLYMTPVLNSYLQELSEQVYKVINGVSETEVGKMYRPMQWLPHVTLGKKLSKEQMQIAFEIMQEGFQPFAARVVRLGLAKTNPHEDILYIDLINQDRKPFEK